MDERQSFNLVFLPGFSMASQVSDVSGRGVGMDVVRTNIQKLNGTIDIRSTLSKGTTFVINLPLTSRFCRCCWSGGDQPLAVPLSMVRRSCRSPPGRCRRSVVAPPWWCVASAADPAARNHAWLEIDRTPSMAC